MDGLQTLPHVLWILVIGLTSLWSNPYTEMSSIQAIDHHRCGSRFGSICNKATKLSSLRWTLWWEVPVFMDCLVYISHVLWMLGKILTILWYNPYTVVPSIQDTDLPRCEPRLLAGSAAKPPNHPKGYVGCAWPFACVVGIVEILKYTLWVLLGHWGVQNHYPVLIYMRLVKLMHTTLNPS